MVIRKRKNKSGSTSVFIVHSKRISKQKHPKCIMIKSFGSSNDKTVIETKVKEAQEYISKLEQEGMGKIVLNIKGDKDISACNVKTNLAASFYGSIYNRYFFGLKNDMLKSICLMRIINPSSKKRTSEISHKYGIDCDNLNKIYRFMDKLVEDNMIDAIKNKVIKNTNKILEKNNEPVDVLFYDLTTVYFENNNESDLKQIGYSKDGKHQHVQVSLAVMVAKYGLPIDYQIFQGNISEGKTLLPVLKELNTRYHTDKITVVADSAMLSKDNILNLESINMKYIVSARIRNLTKKVENEIKSDGYTEINNDMKYKEVTIDNRRLVIVYSNKRKEKDHNERQIVLKRMETSIGKSAKNKLSGSFRKSYVSLTSDSKITIDEDKLERSRELDGYFGFYTNTSVSAQDVISQYHGLWQIEETFRITKSNLKIRPIYHYIDRRIKAHFAICFLSLSLIRIIEYLLKKSDICISQSKLNGMLSDVSTVKITSKNETFNITTDISPEIRSIYKSLKLKLPERFYH